MVDPLKAAKVKMVKTIKDIVVPRVKALGFLGILPHFRRIKNDRFEFLSFQFNRHGGSFVLECGFAKKDDLPKFAQTLPFEKLDYGYTHSDNRLRIKPDGINTEDFWYTYANFDSERQFLDCAELVRSSLGKVEHFFENRV